MEIFKLNNGLSVVLETRKGLGLVSVDVSVNAGYVFEEKGLYGVATVLSKTITKETEDYSKEEILSLTEGEGGILDSRCDMSYSDISMLFHSANIDKSLDILANVLTKPKFHEEEINKQKKNFKEYIKSLRDNPKAFVEIEVYSRAFAGQAYSNNFFAQESEIDSIDSSKIKEFFSKYYNASNMIISIVGDFDIEQVKKICSDKFSAIATGEKYQLPKANHEQFYFFKEDNNNEQVQLKVCFDGVGLNSPDLLKYKILVETLCGGLSSRMFHAMREEDQLVYTFRLANINLYDGGLFCMNAGTGKGKTEILIPKAINQMKKFIEGIENQEVEAAITSYEKRLQSALTEDLTFAASKYSMDILRYGKIRDIKTVQNELKTITKADIIKVAYDILQTKPSFIGTGPKEGIMTLEEIKDSLAKEVSTIDLSSATTRANSTDLNPNWLKLSDSSAEYGEFKTSTLSNGLTVITQYRPNALIACGYWVGAGCENETRAENGISHMLEHMVFKGTRSYVKGQVDKIIEKESAAYLNAFTSNDKTCYYSYKISQNDFYKIAHVLGELVFYPNLSDIEFNGGTREDGSVVKDGEKEVVFEEMKMYEDNPTSVLHANIMACAFGDTAVGRKIIGTRESLIPLRGNDLKAYHDRWYVPNNVTFLAIGDVNHEETVAKLEEMWAEVPYREIASTSYDWEYLGGEINTIKNDKEMSLLSVGFASCPEKNPESLTYKVLANILGEGEVSKLHRRIVDELCLASDIKCFSDNIRNAGVFAIITSVIPENVEKVKEEIFKVIQSVEISEQDVKTAILKLKTDKKMEMLSSSDAFVEIGYSYSNTKVIETIADLEKKLKEITLKEVKYILDKMLKSNPIITVVGKENR